jgi:hypothetical protein
MKKKVTLNHKGLKTNTSDEKRGNPEIQGAKKRPPMKKEATPKHKGLKTKSSNEKRGNLKRQWA